MEPGGCPYCYGLRGHARLRRVLYDELDAEYGPEYVSLERIVGLVGGAPIF